MFVAPTLSASSIGSSSFASSSNVDSGRARSSLGASSSSFSSSFRNRRRQQQPGDCFLRASASSSSSSSSSSSGDGRRKDAKKGKRAAIVDATPQKKKSSESDDGRRRRRRDPNPLFAFLLPKDAFLKPKKNRDDDDNHRDANLNLSFAGGGFFFEGLNDFAANCGGNREENGGENAAGGKRGGLFFEYKLGTTEEQKQERARREGSFSSGDEEDIYEENNGETTTTTTTTMEETIQHNAGIPPPPLSSSSSFVDSTIDEPTAIEDILWPQELAREEALLREKDPDDFDFEGEEDFVASLSRNELFRNVSAETRGFLLFNLIIFMMGSNIVLVKLAQTSISPDAFGLFRFLAASLTFLPFTKYALRDSRILKMGLELGFWCAVGYYFQAVGLDITDASSASFISSFTVISVPLIAMWAGREVPKSTWVAIAVAIFGLALIEGVVPIPGLEAHDTKEALSIVSDAVSDVVSTSVLTGEVVQSNPFEVLDSALSLPLESVNDIAEVATVETVQSLYGDFAILISAIVFAVQVFRTDVLANEEHLGTKEMMGMCSIQLFVVTLFFGGTLLNDVPHDDGQLSTLFTNSLAALSAFDWQSVPWFLVLYTGVLTTAFALYAETVALKYIPSEKASVIYTTEPLWGAAFAYVLLGERMGVNGYVGGALILASSFLSSSSNKAIALPGEEEVE